MGAITQAGNPISTNMCHSQCTVEIAAARCVFQVLWKKRTCVPVIGQMEGEKQTLKFLKYLQRE